MRAQSRYSGKNAEDKRKKKKLPCRQKPSREQCNVSVNNADSAKTSGIVLLEIGFVIETSQSHASIAEDQETEAKEAEG